MNELEANQQSCTDCGVGPDTALWKGTAVMAQGKRRKKYVYKTWLYPHEFVLPTETANMQCMKKVVKKIIKHLLILSWLKVNSKHRWKQSRKDISVTVLVSDYAGNI